MTKSLYIAEKPSVAREFARALGEPMTNHDGYMESEHAVVAWCVGHLVTMSYPEKYDAKYKKWSLATLPFLPKTFKYEVIPAVSRQYQVIAGLLHRPDVDTIYVCTDSGREGEYIYRLVEQMAGVSGKTRKRVWIDSQTEEEILRGIREAKDLSEYDHLSDSAYLRAKEDYLMGINFSRLLTLKYGDTMANLLREKYVVISVGRVMTCVLGMVVRREREIREFVKTPFYRVLITMDAGDLKIEAEWKAVEGSEYFGTPALYKENGFRERKDAQALIAKLKRIEPQQAQILAVERKKEKKYPPLLYNLAELQNDCSRMFHISPDETLRIVQELYEKKMVTYPRTDARVLSTAVAKEIGRNLAGLKNISAVKAFTEEILEKGLHRNIARTRYVNDKLITDHYAIIPTGQGTGSLRGLSPLARNVYETIVRRFLAVFYPPAVYQKAGLTAGMGRERFFASFRALLDPGYLKVMEYSFRGKETQGKGTAGDPSGGQPAASLWQAPASGTARTGNSAGEIAGKGSETGAAAEGAGKGSETIASAEDAGEGSAALRAESGGQPADAQLLQKLSTLKKGMALPVSGYTVREGETSPPKRYNSGSMILAMENAGQLIEDEELREQIKGSGIGTSATRAEILKKLVNNKYLALNKKTQIITPTLRGEMIFDIVAASIKSLLNPELTASWEKGLTYVAEGSITPDEYMEKLEHFIRSRTSAVLGLRNQGAVKESYERVRGCYQKTGKKRAE